MSKHNNFKETEIGRIPKEWEVVRLGNIGSLQYGVTASATKENTGIKFLRITDIKDEGIEWLGVPYCELKEIELKKYELRFGDVLFARIGATTGKTCFIDKPIKGAFGSYLIRFQPNIKNIDTKFLYFYTQSEIYWLQINMSKGGQLKKGLNSKLLGNLKLLLPPLSEQQKIAEILSTVDEAIEKTNLAIEKTQRLKKGLMQKLFTEGVVDSRQHTGERKFKETEIGKIPKEWELVKLREVADLNRGKFAHRPRNDPKFYGGKIPFIQTGDISEANGIIKNYSQTLNEEGLKISKLFKKGTTVISIAGNIGDVGILDFDACFPDSVVGIRVNNKADHLFLMYLLQEFKYKLSSIAPRSTQKNINLEILESFSLPLPAIPEQQKIAEILSTVDKRLELLRMRREKLERIKKGLMNDLLTGKRRVLI